MPRCSFAVNNGEKKQRKLGEGARRRVVYHGSVPGNIGPLEIIIVLIIALVVFGPKRLPELGRSLGKGIREFRGSISGRHDDEDKQPPQELDTGGDEADDRAGKGETVGHKRT
jgi:sec-independent protein translocase protein TatA